MIAAVGARNISKFDAGVVQALMQARYQNSSRGQFISEDAVFLGDPKSQDLQNPQNLNAYSYAIDNPINKSDPLGKHVELVSRPIGDWNGLPASDFGAHAFLAPLASFACWRGRSTAG